MWIPATIGIGTRYSLGRIRLLNELDGVRSYGSSLT